MDIIVCLVECSHSSIGQIICVTETGKVMDLSYYLFLRRILRACLIRSVFSYFMVLRPNNID